MSGSYLDGWVATRVEDLSGLDTGDGRHLKRRRRPGDVGVERRASEGVGRACSDMSVEELNAVRETNVCGVNPIELQLRIHAQYRRRNSYGTIEDESNLLLRRGESNQKTYQ